jgi:hypothetical protein
MLTMWKKNGFSPPASTAAEGVLVQQRRAGGHDHAVELELADVLLDELLARVRAHVFVVAREGTTPGSFSTYFATSGQSTIAAMLCPQWQM